jgi:hypothetical protein
LVSATRNATPQAPCTELHGRYRRPKQLAEYAKNPGKTRVFERRGQEPNFSMFSQCFFGGSNGSFSLRIMPKLSSKFEEVLDLDGFDAVNGRDGFKTES